MKNISRLAFTASNALSILRVPFALMFLFHYPLLRCLAILLAMITDSLDGFLARRYRQVSQFGAVLDPLMDKFFVVFAMMIFIKEGHLSFLEMTSLICRDFSIVLFGFYLYLTGKWTQYQFRAIWCGKLTTALQFLVLIGLSLDYAIPKAVFATFVTLGFFALIELYYMSHPEKVVGQPSPPRNE